MKKPARPSLTLDVVAPVAEEIPRAKPARTAPGGKTWVKVSLYIHPAALEQLRELAFTERTKVNSLIAEAVDRLFADRGLPLAPRPGDGDEAP